MKLVVCSIFALAMQITPRPPVKIVPKHETVVLHGVENISFIYGAATALNAIRGKSDPKDLCELLDQADERAISLGKDFDMAYMNTLAGMSQLRQVCK